MNFEVVIGVEIHVEMKTKSKMFSAAPVAFKQVPNTLVSAVDMAFPGTLPTVNKQAVINAIRVSHALSMHIDNELWFDRKNYFYPDLPKGYQITQDKRPIGSNGFVDVEMEDGVKRIEIERLHLEEDTCKQFHMADYSLIDLNRAGTPLIEIVTKPTIRSAQEAMKYVETIRSIVQYTETSDGKMEEGSLRCDINISLRPFGSDKYGVKVEIKNLNSIANVEKAVEYEIERQTKLLLSGQAVEQETRRFDEATKTTVLMRKKTSAVDYKYFTEPNITPIKLSQEFIEKAINSSSELASSKLKRYVEDLGLSHYDARIILLDRLMALYFEKALEYGVNPKQMCNWLMGDIASYLNKNGITINELKLSLKHLTTLIKMVEEGGISLKQGREIFLEIVENDFDPKEIVSKRDIGQISDESVIYRLVNEVLQEFPQSIEDFKAGKDRAVGFLIGQIMKKSQGKANPALTSKIVVEVLKSL